MFESHSAQKEYIKEKEGEQPAPIQFPPTNFRTSKTTALHVRW